MSVVEPTSREREPALLKWGGCVESSDRAYRWRMLTRTQCQEARKAVGLSTRALASAAGVAFSTISRFELGRVTPNQSTLTVLRIALERHGARFTEPTCQTAQETG